MKRRYFSDFEDHLIASSKSALIEVTRILRPYSEAIVLIGGWVPYLLLESHKNPEDNFRHVGSIDIDLIVDPDRVSDSEYQTIVELIEQIGWEPVTGKRFTFKRSIKGKDGVDRDITVDFLTLPNKISGKRPRHRGVQPDLSARTMSGGELGLQHYYWYSMKGEMPNGAVTEVRFKMLDVVGCISTKSIALGDRYKHKDAYDIVSVLDHYGDGVSEVANAFQPFLGEPQIQDSLKNLHNMFSSERSEGPLLYAEFMEQALEKDKEIFAQRGFMLVSEFLRKLGGYD